MNQTTETACVACGRHEWRPFWRGLKKCGYCGHCAADLDLTSLDFKTIYDDTYFEGDEYDDYLRERATDMRDVTFRVLSNLLGVEHDLEQQVAQFATQVSHVIARYGVGDFVGFLDRVGRDGGEILRAIPFASRNGVAEAGHDAEQAV